MAPDKDPKPPSVAPQEQQPDPVEDFHKRLAAETMTHEQLKSGLTKLTDDVREKNIAISQEQLAKLRAETTVELQEIADQQNWDKAMTDLEQRSLEVSLQALEQQLQPKTLVNSVKETFANLWENSKETAIAIGGVLGVAVPEKAGDAWNFLVRNFWKIMATPTDFGMEENRFTKFARMKVNQADMWEGVTGFAELNKNNNVVVGIFQEDCVKAYKQILPLITPFPGADMNEKIASYLRKYMTLNPGTAANKTTITMERLITANLTADFPVTSGSPEASQNLFGINGLKLNQSMPLTSPVELQVGSNKLRIASDSVTCNGVQYKVKITEGGIASSSVALTAKDVQNIGMIEIRLNGGDIPVTIQDIVNNLPGTLTVKHLTFEKIS